MRTATTTSQQNALDNPKDLSTHLRVSVDNGSGVYADLSDLEGYNWIRRVTYEEASGQPTAKATVHLAREAHKLSLSPFMDGSKLNASGAVIDIARKILIETAVLPCGKNPAANEWEKVFRGYIEQVAWERSPMVLTCLDLGGELLQWFIRTQQVYAETDNLLHEVIQDIVDDNTPAVATVAANYAWTGIVTVTTGDTSEVVVGDFIGIGDGTATGRSPYFEISAITPNVDITIDNAGGRTIPTGNGAGESVMIPDAERITLYVEGANPAWAIRGVAAVGYIQSKGRVLTKIRELAQQIGYEVSYRYNSGTDDFQLTLWTPDRAAAAPDVTIAPSKYKTFQRLNINRSKIRNIIEITALVAGVRTTVIREDAASKAKYNDRYMGATESSAGQIDTIPEMQDFGDIILGDLKDPEADAAVPIPYRWDLQPADYARFLADGARFDTDQDLGVVNLKHVLPVKGEPRTVIAVRGKPSGGVNRWLRLEGMEGVAPPVDLRSDDAPTGTGSTPHVSSVIIEFDDPRAMDPPVPDWAYTRVYTHTADPGDPPNVAYLVATGRQTRFEVGGLLPGTLYHSRCEHIDEAGNVGNVSVDIQETTQMVGAYHEDPGSVKNNLVPNGDFNQATLPIATNPPDGWDVTTGAWATDAVAETGAGLQQTGGRSIKFPSGAAAVAVMRAQLIPASVDVLYRFEWGIRASANTNLQHHFGFGFRTYDKDGVFILSTNLAGTGLVGAVNTWEQWEAVSYIATDPANATARYIRPWVGKSGPNAFDFYIDRFFITQAMASFAAYRSAALNAGAGVFTSIACDAQVFDLGGTSYGGTVYGFNPADGKFTCLQPGRYIFQAGAGLAAFANGNGVSIAFYLNGVLDKTVQTQQAGATGNIRTCGTYTIDLVKGDFVEAFLFNGDVLRAFLVGAAETYFIGSRIT